VTATQGFERIAALDGRPVVQVGLIVRDLDRGMAAYSGVWGVAPWRVYTYGPKLLTSQTYRGQPAAFSMAIALAGSGPQLELIQPLEGPSVYTEWLEQHSEGLHHVAVEVDSLEQMTREMEGAGYPMIQSGLGFGPDGDGGFAYYDTQHDLGLVVEAIEEAARIRDPERVFP
jgi:glyoxalase/bleomycin resistance protein/dioxygenase superfamily protein